MVYVHLSLETARLAGQSRRRLGLNRGRRNATDLRIGDAHDFWKEADLVPNKRLMLAQMKVPGKAWLEFDLPHDTLVQTAHFFPTAC